MNSTNMPPSHRRSSLSGPIVLIALGVILLLDQLVPGWGVGKTWPVLLIVIGLAKVVQAGQAPRPPEGPRV